MQNLLIVLLILFVSLFVILPLVEKTAKPMDAEKMQKLQKTVGILMMLMVVALSFKYCAGGF